MTKFPYVLRRFRGTLRDHPGVEAWRTMPANGRTTSSRPMCTESSKATSYRPQATGYRLKFCHHKSGILVKAIRVGAAARASNILAGNRVAVPYFRFRASIVLVSRVRFVSVSRPENKLSVCR